MPIFFERIAGREGLHRNSTGCRSSKWPARRRRGVLGSARSSLATYPQVTDKKLHAFENASARDCSAVSSSVLPSIQIEGPYEVFFTSHDRGEPPHVHVSRENMSAKVWLSPVRVAYNLGFSRHELRRIERLVTAHEQLCLRNGMNTSEPKAGERITAVRVTDDSLSVDLLDGRTVIVPLVWYPRLSNASQVQRENFRITGAGFIIHWPDVDEHLSSQGLLAGAPAPGVVTASTAG